MAFCTWSAAACSPVGYDSRASLSVPSSLESLVVDLDDSVLELRSLAAPVGEGRGVDWVEVLEEASACSPRASTSSRVRARQIGYGTGQEKAWGACSHVRAEIWCR